MNKIDEKVKKLLEYDLKPTLRGGWKITEEMRVLIHEIAEECNSLEVTQKKYGYTGVDRRGYSGGNLYTHAPEDNFCANKDTYALRSENFAPPYRQKA